MKIAFWRFYVWTRFFELREVFAWRENMGDTRGVFSSLIQTFLNISFFLDGSTSASSIDLTICWHFSLSAVSRYKTEALTFLFHMHFLACPLGLVSILAAVPKRMAYLFLDTLSLSSGYDAYLYLKKVYRYKLSQELCTNFKTHFVFSPFSYLCCLGSFRKACTV